jgi:phosphoribosyl-ATP pyrophosphohydrolase
MNLSTILFQASHNAGTASNAGFLRECGQQARQLETSALDLDVARAHVQFGDPAPGFPVQDVSTPTKQNMLDARMELIGEECDELMIAMGNRDLAAIAHEAVDLIYSTVGLLVMLGLPLMPFWRAVHRANMAKVKRPGGGKWMKPEGWQAADAREVLYQVRRNAEGVE